MPTRRGICAAGAGLLLAASTALAQAPEIPAGVLPLDDAGIIALLDGHSFRFTAYDEPLTGTTTWDRAAGTVTGDYVRNGTERGGFQASWFVTGSRSCTQQGDRAPVCQSIYRHGEGFMEVNEAGAVHAVSVPVSP